MEPQSISFGVAGLMAAVGGAAGALGALVGIGGGVVLVPALVVGFGLPMRDAVALSLVSVVATSTTAGSAYVAEGMANMRLGMTLEIATTLGGMAGGLVAVAIPEWVLAGLFAVLLAVTALLLVRRRADESSEPVRGAHEAAHGWQERGGLSGTYDDPHLGRVVHYAAQRTGLGSAGAFLAGAMSGLLGVGGGFLKVPAMTLAMQVPLRVAAATSNFMIGVTAIASLPAYLARGYVRPMLAATLVIGVVAGSWLGIALSRRVPTKWLRVVLAIVLAGVAFEMIRRGLRGLHGP